MRRKRNFVPSIHEPLISEDLFEKVQCIMDGNVNPARHKKIDFPKLLDQALSNLVDLAKVYADGDIDLKRKIIGSTFPEKLAFHENVGRTARPNILLSFILQINSELEPQKKPEKK